MAARSWWSRAMSMSSRWSLPAFRHPSPRSAPRSRKTSLACSGRWRMSRSCVSTAIAPGRRRRFARPISRCRFLPRERVCALRCFPRDKTPMISRSPADVIWSREIEGGDFSTPERRAALEKRVGEIVNSIRDEVVRRYYRQDFGKRLASSFAPEISRSYANAGYARGGFRTALGGAAIRESAGRFGSRGALGSGIGAGRSGTPNRPGGGIAPGPYQPQSSQLAASPLMRGQRAAISRREALILQCLLNHPWLLHDHLEEAAALELAHGEAHRLRAGIIAAFASDHHLSSEPSEQSEKLRADLVKSGFSKEIQRVESAITTAAVWGVRGGAARDDVLSTWRQLVSLHRQVH